jgi:hypothetical protein
LLGDELAAGVVAQVDCYYATLYRFASKRC